MKIMCARAQIQPIKQSGKKMGSIVLVAEKKCATIPQQAREKNESNTCRLEETERDAKPSSPNRAECGTFSVGYIYKQVCMYWLVWAPLSISPAWIIWFGDDLVTLFSEWLESIPIFQFESFRYFCPVPSSHFSLLSLGEREYRSVSPFFFALVPTMYLYIQGVVFFL